MTSPPAATPGRLRSLVATVVLALDLLLAWTLQGQTSSPAGAATPGTPSAKAAAAAGRATPADPAPKRAPKPLPEPHLMAPLAAHLVLQDSERQRDFPDLCVDHSGAVWVAYIEHDPQAGADTLRLARRDENGALDPGASISRPGVLHHPAIAADGGGGIWCFWGQANKAGVVTLRARRFAGGKAGDEIELAASPGAGNSFADAGTDPSGRVWVAWQEIRPGASRILARHWSPGSKKWSAPANVSAAAGGGCWEPRLAFTDAEGAWIVYDCSAGSEFNLHLARVTAKREVTDRALTDSPEYEARASIAPDGEGGLWIAAERGRRQWGLDTRGHENEIGLNARKRILLGRFDIRAGRFTEVPVIDYGRPAPAPDPSPGFAVNLPSVAVVGGQVWLSCRAYAGPFWRVAALRYDPRARQWSEPMALAESTMGQDRRNELTASPGGDLWLAWPSDARKNKQCGISAVHAAALDAGAEIPLRPVDSPFALAHLPEPAPYLEEPTPPRPLGEHHTWELNGRTYRLCWGDLHRHTDISNCRTGFDGCILEAYRYAYDMAGLDFLGTSDHTDTGKPYHPYEWWHTQRQVDVFHAPGSFASLYAYEREQKFPWGHRNLVFAQRGGPVIYINRVRYRSSPWQAALPVEAGLDEILPEEVWDVLRRYKQPCAIISHTGATSMGTDWARYERIDNAHENLVEIYQGARVSYEALGAPQPTVGLREGENYTPHRLAGDEHPKPPAAIVDFDAGFETPPGYNSGVYQVALAQGHRLGVFASSDHLATHTSFGGVYVEEFTREGIIAGFNARRTCAATDKIFIQLSCGDRMMGETFESKEKPALEVRVEGTAPLRRVTIVRNEKDHHVVEPPAAGKTLVLSWTDEAPLPGENRYYLRIEQVDGNMGWSSPLWIDVEGPGPPGPAPRS